jgi:ATP-binding cassette subfamily E protein 1
MHSKKTAFVVEHDFIMATYLADRVVVYDGTPGVESFARTPQVRVKSKIRSRVSLESKIRSRGRGRGRGGVMPEHHRLTCIR